MQEVEYWDPSVQSELNDGIYDIPEMAGGGVGNVSAEIWDNCGCYQLLKFYSNPQKTDWQITSPSSHHDFQHLSNDLVQWRPQLTADTDLNSYPIFANCKRTKSCGDAVVKDKDAQLLKYSPIDDSNPCRGGGTISCPLDSEVTLNVPWNYSSIQFDLPDGKCGCLFTVGTWSHIGTPVYVECDIDTNNPPPPPNGGEVVINISLNDIEDCSNAYWQDLDESNCATSFWCHDDTGELTLILGNLFVGLPKCKGFHNEEQTSATIYTYCNLVPCPDPIVFEADIWVPNLSEEDQTELFALPDCPCEDGYNGNNSNYIQTTYSDPLLTQLSDDANIYQETENSLTISNLPVLGKQSCDLKILGIAGNEIVKMNIQNALASNVSEINIRDLYERLDNGIYLAVLQSGNDILASQKLVKLSKL